MKTLSIIFIIFSLFLLFGCKSSKYSEDKEFKEYLSYFNITPKANCTYVFIPSTQCIGCIMIDAKTLSETQNINTYIFSNISAKHFLNFKNYFFDKEDKVTALKFVNLENKIIYFGLDRILFCKKINLINPKIKNNNCTSLNKKAVISNSFCFKNYFF